MTAHAAATPAVDVDRPAQALLALIEADRARRCAQILGDAEAAAAKVRGEARAAAHARIRLAFAEQRQRGHEQRAAAEARLATRRRLHAQQRTAALLELAWQQLPGALAALWRERATRSRWVEHVLGFARERLPGSAPWRIVHAAEWPADETAALARTLAAELGAAPALDGDSGIDAGLRVLAGSNVVDGTTAGLLADRADVEARLLRLLEGAP